MKVLIMGCGRIGAEVAVQLWNEGHRVTVLETDKDRFVRLPERMVEGDGTTLVGDGMVEEDLILSGIREADLFIAVDVRDSRNALAAQKATHIFHVPQVICRIGDSARQETYSELGVTAVSPTQVTTRLILNAIEL